MNNMIKIFENEEFGSLRILKEDNGRIMFCGKDVASALGYSNTKDAIRRHCRWGVKHDLPHPQSPARTIEMVFIPEGDVYRLISHSRLPSAEKFESWIFDEVLPTIRRTGGYVASEDMFIENYLPFLDEPYRDLFRLQMTAIEKLNERIRHDQPLVEFANQVAGTDNLIDMNAMAKLARAENISVGRNKLYSWLKRTGVLMSNNLPYQRYIDRGYFAVKESVFE
ncbi:MAG: phage antirepressor KilAC domain-containing protein, partial [Ruminococcus bicirculans]|nr:phage antirepressor KilAC domain-containing protein [Ruminococcus bicirculans (ex Wegman et al. 2014)]